MEVKARFTVSCIMEGLYNDESGAFGNITYIGDIAMEPKRLLALFRDEKGNVNEKGLTIFFNAVASGVAKMIDECAGKGFGSHHELLKEFIRLIIEYGQTERREVDKLWRDEGLG
jgi:hypothetical protein